MRLSPVIVPVTFVLCLAAAPLRAEIHRFVPPLYHNAFSARHDPALHIKSGDRVVTSVLDDAGIGADGTAAAPAPGPHTGPFFVEGAEPGDLLVITIEKLQPNRATGSSLAVMSANAADPARLSSRRDERRLAWSIDSAAGLVRFDLSAIGRGNEWSTRFERPFLELPLEPALGSIAVAPPADEGGVASLGAFGGSLASSAVRQGARVMLPVFHTGALLYLGHGHARQGDGRIGGSGVETSLDVEFSVEVVKKQEWPHSSVVRPSTVVGEFPVEWPRIETADYLITVGGGATLADALQRATLELHHWLDDDFGLSELATTLFLGQAMEYEVANLADATISVAAKVRKSYLPRPAAAP